MGDYQTMFLILSVIILFVGMWHTRRMKNWIHFSYTSESNQGWDGVVKTRGRFAVIEGKRFKLLPQYSVTRQYTKGFSSFFPTKITHYDFVWNSDFPIDHKTGKPAMVSPEVEHVIDQESALRELAGSQRQSLSSRAKVTGLEKFMPIIMIVVVLAVVWVGYSVYQMQANDKITQQAIIDIYQTFNKMGVPVGK